MTCTASSLQGAIKEPAASLFRTYETHPGKTFLSAYHVIRSRVPLAILAEFLTASQEPDNSSQLTLITTSLLQLDAFSGVRSNDLTDHREGKKILSGKHTFSSSLAQILRFYNLQQSLNGLRTRDRRERLTESLLR